MRRSRRDLVLRCLLAATAGALGGAAFPPRTWVWLLVASIITFVALLLRESARRGALIGLCFGLGWFGIVVWWAQVVGTDAWFALALACAVFISVMAAGIAVVSRLPFAPLWISCVWVLQETVRSNLPFGGFPWGRVVDGAGLAFAQALTFGGFSYVTFLIVLIAATAAVLVDLAIRSRRNVASLSIPVLTNLGVLAVVLVVPLWASGSASPRPAGSATIAIVQGDVPGAGLDFQGRASAVLDNQVRTTKVLAAAVADGTARRPSLVVWPENSTDVDPILDQGTRLRVESAVRAVGVPILLGAVLEGESPTQVRNAAVLWEPRTGPRVVYVKQRPVPFGEFVPFRSALSPVISRFNRIPRDFVAGKEPGVVRVGDATLGLAICFEVAHDDIQRETVQQGADVLVVLTNNATYSATNQPEQQFAITRQRSLELGRSTVVAATTGISAVIRPDGAIQAQLPQRQAGYLVEDVTTRHDRTNASRAGQGIQTALAIVGLGAVIVAAATTRRRRAADAPRDEELT